MVYGDDTMKGVSAVRVATGLFLAISFATGAQASFVLTLDDPTTGGTDVMITDGGAGDANPVTGAITYIGSVGVFDVNVTTGTSKPVQGPGVMDLNSIDVSSSTGGTLNIGLTDTDFTGTATSYSANYGGTTTSTVSFDFLYDASNTEFGGSSFASAGPLTGSSFSGSGSYAIPAANPYSLTILASITHASGNQSTSFDAELRPVPLPAALWLFGSGLLGLASCVRRRG
jgi:hypothetical protein